MCRSQMWHKWWDLSLKDGEHCWQKGKCSLPALIFFFSHKVFKSLPPNGCENKVYLVKRNPKLGIEFTTNALCYGIHCMTGFTKDIILIVIYAVTTCFLFLLSYSIPGTNEKDIVAVLVNLRNDQRQALKDKYGQENGEVSWKNFSLSLQFS